MKTNYFYSTLASELSCLCRAAEAPSREGAEEAYSACKDLHKAFSLRLFRDFITPAQRDDLYALSAAILSVFPSLILSVRCCEGERNLIARSAALFLPLRWDENVLRIGEKLSALWGEGLCSPPARACRRDFEFLFDVTVKAVLNNV